MLLYARVQSLVWSGYMNLPIIWQFARHFEECTVWCKKDVIPVYCLSTRKNKLKQTQWILYSMYLRVEGVPPVQGCCCMEQAQSPACRDRNLHNCWGLWSWRWQPWCGPRNFHLINKSKRDGIFITYYFNFCHLILYLSCKAISANSSI